MSEISDRVSLQMKELINYKIFTELSQFKNHISQLWLLKKSGDALHYIISLKHNNFETRDAMLEIIVNYESKAISKRHPVTFQFIEKDSERSLFGESLKPLNEPFY